MMEFKENAVVLTSANEDVGKIDRIVINPRTKEVTHFVVRKGFLFTRDKVIPVDRVDTATEDQVILKQGTENPDELPDFEETHYILVDDVKSLRKQQQGYVRPVIPYGPAGVGWWRVGFYPDYGKPPYVARTERNIPDDTIPLEEGAAVVSRNGEKVGQVERVYTDPDEHRATHFSISQGLISKDRKIIPTMWVDRVLEDRIQLSVEEDLIERLPSYPSESGDRR